MDWYDGPAACTISEAFARCPRVPPKPKEPAWFNNTPVASFKSGDIYEILNLDDRIMHTYTCSGHCFVWNAPNQQYEDGFRLYTFRSKDGWGRVSILAHELRSLIAGTGSRMYCGNWRKLAEERGARYLNGEAIVLLDYDRMYLWGTDAGLTQADIDGMKELVGKWYDTLLPVMVPEPTKEELARKIEYR